MFRAIACIAAGGTLTFVLAGPAPVVERQIRPQSVPNLVFTPDRSLGIGRVTRDNAFFSERWTLEYSWGCTVYVVENPPALPAWLWISPSSRVRSRDVSRIQPDEEIVSTTTATGWPCRAFQCTEHLRFGAQLPPTIRPTIEHGWPLGNRSSISSPQAVIPYKPIWPGLLANWALFTAATSMLALIGPAGRAIRRRRNRCPHCNYARAGLADDVLCPECGRARSR